MFAQQFGKYACEGDSISCKVGRFTATATIHRDDCGDMPDQRDDGFWPSHDSKAAGHVLPEHFEAEQERAQKAMDAWRNDEWFYCGVAVTIECEGITLTGPYYAVALWGIECNYPDSDNAYLNTVANELLPDAIEAAKAKLAALCTA